MRLSLVRRLTVARSADEGPQFIAAASGMVAHGGHLFIIGDDETHLAVVNQNDFAPGRLMRLFPEILPIDPAKRKAAKPDLETLLFLPASDSFPHGGLLALGSGSTLKRRRGVALSLDANSNSGTPEVLDLTALFAAIDQAVPETNVEGAVIRGEELILFNRGNRSHPGTVALGFRAADMRFAKPSLEWSKQITLPEVSGVALSITDVCLLGDGTILASAVAEDTANAYDDGRLAGAAFALLASDMTVVRVEMIEPAIKIEGIHGRLSGRQIDVLAVSDADNPAAAAGLYKGAI